MVKGLDEANASYGFPVRDAGCVRAVEVPTLKNGPETGDCVRRAFMFAYPYRRI